MSASPRGNLTGSGSSQRPVLEAPIYPLSYQLASRQKPRVEPEYEGAVTPETNPPQVEESALRWTFARSLCNAHKLARISERDACDDGVPCKKLDACLGMANSTLAYMTARRDDRA